MRRDPNTPERPPRGAAAILTLFLALFVGGGLYSGWIFLTTVRALLSDSPTETTAPIALSDRLPGLPDPVRQLTGGRSRPEPTQVAPTATAVPEVPEEVLPTWDGKDRLTILLLGIDQREDEKDLPTRSDTMILLTVDPLNLTAALLSIPRDLYVPLRIPGQEAGRGYTEGKINSAHFYGELEQSGLGPEAARRTLQFNLGVPIHYTARVDFRGFEQLVDAIGGITIDVDRAILDNEYPNEKYGITRLYIPVGPQRMNGMTALRYARSRHADSDFGRLRRQQRVIQSARDEVLALNLVTATRLPQMVRIVFNSVMTDISPSDVPALAWLAARIPRDNIVSRQIDHTMIDDVNGDGTVLIPNREKIRPIVQELFYNPVVKQEAARIEVLNGTGRDGLAAGVQTALLAQGLNVVRIDTADRSSYPETQIVDRGKNATASHLASLLRVPTTSVRKATGTSGYADITVILGSDYRPGV